MAIRLPLAFILGLVIYMIAMVMTTYDGIASMILQPIMGSILTGLALIALLVVGSPLLIGAVWKRWRRVGWLVLAVTMIGIACLIASWHPFRVKVLNPDTGAMVDSFHPALAVGGWLAAMFGVAFCPAIGFRGQSGRLRLPRQQFSVAGPAVVASFGTCELAFFSLPPRPGDCYPAG
jgi:hypothetical protein